MRTGLAEACLSRNHLRYFAGLLAVKKAKLTIEQSRRTGRVPVESAGTVAACSVARQPTTWSAHEKATQA